MKTIINIIVIGFFIFSSILVSLGSFPKYDEYIASLHADSRYKNISKFMNFLDVFCKEKKITVREWALTYIGLVRNSDIKDIFLIDEIKADSTNSAYHILAKFVGKNETVKIFLFDTVKWDCIYEFSKAKVDFSASTTPFEKNYLHENLKWLFDNESLTSLYKEAILKFDGYVNMPKFDSKRKVWDTDKYKKELQERFEMLKKETPTLQGDNLKRHEENLAHIEEIIVRLDSPEAYWSNRKFLSSEQIYEMYVFKDKLIVSIDSQYGNLNQPQSGVVADGKTVRFEYDLKTRKYSHENFE